jgi:hypothetical protein
MASPHADGHREQLKRIRRPQGLSSPGGARDDAAPSLLPPMPRRLDVPGLGRIELDETVFVARDGPQAAGLLFGRDEASRLCLLTFDLAEQRGSRD